MRKYFIDNIRIICILLLFPFHTAMIYNNYGEPFYVHGASLKGASLFTGMVYPWWMTLLFTLAGISSAYALKNRSIKAYVQERLWKLLVPFLVGLVLIVPVQTYIADLFHNGYQGNYFEHYAVFFTKITDLSGYDGGLTPGHTWFMLYLFIVSMLMLPLMHWYGKKEKKIDGSKVTVLKLLPLFLVILLLTPVIELGGKSIGESLACFAIGYFLLSIDQVQIKLGKSKVLLSVLFGIVLLIRLIMLESGQSSGLVWDIEQRLVTWFGILAILGLGVHFLEFTNPVTKYLSLAAFPLYYFHQSVLVIVGFFTLKFIEPTWLQFIVIMVGTFFGSLLLYEVFRRNKVACKLFGIKHHM